MPVVIFVTAYDQHAEGALEVNALDYLLKPSDDNRFAIAVARARNDLSQRRDRMLGWRLTSLLAEVQTPGVVESGEDKKRSALQRFIVKSGGRIVFIKANESG